MHKTQLKSLKSIFETFKIIHLAFVKTQFAFSLFLKNNETLYKTLKIKSQTLFYILELISNLIRFISLWLNLLSKRIMFGVCGGIGTIPTESRPTKV